MLTDRVIKSKDRDKILYIVEYYDNNGKRIRKKQFNATRYGEENAKWMANKWLELHCEGECLIEKMESECHIYVLHETGIHTIICDLDMYDEFSQYSWFVTKDCATFYAQCNKLKKSMHRIVVGATKFEEKVDHINHNGLDNRRCNLRLVDNRENQKNLSYKSNNKSGTIGVRFNSQINCWQAQWRDNKTNKQCIKSFNIKKFGNDKAKQMAIDYRKKMEKENGYITGSQE